MVSRYMDSYSVIRLNPKPVALLDHESQWLSTSAKKRKESFPAGLVCFCVSGLRI